MTTAGEMKATLLALDESQAAQIQALITLVAKLQEENANLRERVAHLSKQMFGRKSERLQAGQLDLFRSGEVPAAFAEVEGAAVSKNIKTKKKGAHGRGFLPPHLKRIEHRLDVPESDRCCSVCDSEMSPIGEAITERAHFVPATFIVNRYVRIKLACPHGHEVKTAKLPAGVVEGSKFDASVYAHVAVAKYNDHLPLNLLQGIFKRHGIKLARQTMWDMLVRIDEIIAQPVLEQMKKELLDESILHADETSVTMRVEDQKGSKKGWVWGWRNEPIDPIHDQHKVLIEFSLGRGGDTASAFLGSWSGALICDGYEGYNAFVQKNGITRAGCWAHARRPFFDALEKNPRWATLPIILMGRLFALERAVTARAKRLRLDSEATIELRQAVRDRSTKRLMDRIFDLMWELDGVPQITPESKFGKGVRYVLNQESRLRTCLSDARIPLHNNDSERDLRHVILGRKNWQIFASPWAGEVACRLYSLMLSCRQNDINPEAYLADVLMAAETTPSSQVASLTPWAWAARQEGAALAE